MDMINLLREFARLTIEEDELEAQQGEEEKEDMVDEFSGAGAVAGYALPLGMSPTYPQADGTKKKNSKRNVGWK